MADFLLNWSPIDNITSQIVQHKTASVNTWTDDTTLPPLESSYLLSGLISNIVYDFRIASTCSVGGDILYTPTSRDVNNSCPDITACINQGSLLFSFVPTLGDVTKYTVELYREGTQISELVYNSPFPNPISGQFTNLVLPASYQIRVKQTAMGIDKFCQLLSISAVSTVFTAYWGWVDDKSTIVGDTQVVALQRNGVFANTGNITADFRDNNSPKYLVMAEPLSQPLKTQWFGSINNNGNVGTINDFFGIPVNVGSYRLYSTNYLSQQNDTSVVFSGSGSSDIGIAICPTCCPDGYTLSPDGEFCYKVEQVDAIPPSGGGPSTTLIARNAIQYSTCGSYIYSSGYSSDGTGSSTIIPTSNSFWLNWDGVSALCSDNTTTAGPLNRCGLWTSTPSSGQDIGFSVCVSLTQTKTYYIGIACDNYGTIKVDGQVVIQQDEIAINNQYLIVGACFKTWHIYPVELSAGPHYIELLGHNVSSIAGFGCEIYDNTSAEIIAATAYTDLNLIFSTKDKIGTQVELGTGGYTCPSGYSLATCDSPIKCKKVTQTTVGC